MLRVALRDRRDGGYFSGMVTGAGEPYPEVTNRIEYAEFFEIGMFRGVLWSKPTALPEGLWELVPIHVEVMS